MVLAILRQGILGVAYTILSCSSGAIAYFLSCLEGLTQSAIWAITRTYLVFLDSWLSAGHIVQFIVDSALVTYHQAVFNTTHALIGSGRNLIFQTTDAARVGVEQLQLVVRSCLPKAQMKFVGPYVYRKRPVGEKIVGWVRFT